MSNKLLEFIENGSPVTCLQFHPYEFLMAAGRNDGSVDLYDLESKQMISRVERREAGGNSVKCITFSDSGECLFPSLDGSRIKSSIGLNQVGVISVI
jgi:katanin p80 WD40 repeat-containing subunit B1